MMKKFTLLFCTLMTLQGFSQDTSCVWQDGFYRYYVKLITDDLPASDFNKTDFINHLIANSNPSGSDLEFLDNSITEVYPAFPSSTNDSLRRSVSVVCDYDAMIMFLMAYTESIEFVEFQCEAELNIEEFDATNGIQIYPNPITESSYIKLDIKTDFKYLKIYGITGNLLYTEKIENINLIEFNQFKLKHGIFFITFISENLTVSKKILYK